MRTHPVLNFLIFIAFSVIGYTLSLRFYQSGDPHLSEIGNKVTMEGQSGIAALENGQRSILLVGASAINGVNPQLESVWLATYLPSGTTIQLLPIFPTAEEQTSALEQELELNFSLRKEDGIRKLDNSFLSALEKNNYWWSGYFIFDEVALTKLIMLLGGIQLNKTSDADAPKLQGELEAMEDSENAYSEQMSLLQSLCHKLSDNEHTSNLSQLINLIPSHIITDMDAGQLQMELETLSSHHQDRTCRFPTLEISRVEP